MGLEMSSKEKAVHPALKDPLTKRIYYIIRHYLMHIVDEGLEYLKRIYLETNSGNVFQEFTAENYFDKILKDYVRRKVKNQVRFIITSALDCLPYYETKHNVIVPEFLDKIVEEKHPAYTELDLILIHSSRNHPASLELHQMSKLTFRIALIQATRLLSCKQKDVTTYADIILATFSSSEKCLNSFNAIVGIFDQIMDCFERNLDIINIAFYKPTWNLRDFTYGRKIYEYGINLIEQEIRSIYSGDGSD